MTIVFIDACSSNTCRYYGKCVNVRSTYMCVCEPCDDGNIEVVCGSDGKTYASECLLRRQSCLDQVDKEVVKREPCGKFMYPKVWFILADICHTLKYGKHYPMYYKR